jgi:integrase
MSLFRIGQSQAKIALDKASGVTDWTLHDLRRTFATRLAELGVAPHVIERLLNHVTGSLSPIALVYNKAKYQEEMRAAILLWETQLKKLLSNQDQPRTS